LYSYIATALDTQSIDILHGYPPAPFDNILNKVIRNYLKDMDEYAPIFVSE
jgi:hypothetical protein